MDKSTTPDEKPKRRVAKDVITQKRKYFVPAHGVGDIDADSAEGAVKLAKKQSEDNSVEDGDGK